MPRISRFVFSENLKGVFFIVGPTATGKSDIAADVAGEIDAEIVSGDAFQIYRGLDLLTAKPDSGTLAKVPHHLIGTVPIGEEMNAEKFRGAALRAIDEIHSRGKLALVVGGSGLYLKALTHGLSAAPSADPDLRAELEELSLDDLRAKLSELDPETARKIDGKNRRRLMRAVEICLASGHRASEQRRQWSAAETAAATTPGLFLFRDRAELHARINRRVELMFESGAIDEVAAAGPSRTGIVSGTRAAISATATKMIGLHEIQDHLAGKMSLPQCIEKIQQATRHYAKRQLTWFRHQTSFEPLNLSLLTHDEAVKWISQRARRSLAKG